MRHKLKKRKLNMPTEERLAVLYSQARALLRLGKIKLTLPRAKEVRRIAEKLISRAKREDSVHNRRMLGRIIKDKKEISALCEMAMQRFEGRPGGFTRIIKIGFRLGDATPMAQIELV